MGEAPAYAFSPRASAKRLRSSPISASTRAPSWTPRPGKLTMISASGCWGKVSSTAFARSSEAVQAASNYTRRASICLPRGLFDERRLVGPVGPKDPADPLCFGNDAPLSASPLQCGPQLRWRTVRGQRRIGRSAPEGCGSSPGGRSLAPGTLGFGGGATMCMGSSMTVPNSRARGRGWSPTCGGGRAPAVRSRARAPAPPRSVGQGLRQSHLGGTAHPLTARQAEVPCLLWPAIKAGPPRGPGRYPLDSIPRNTRPFLSSVTASRPLSRR